jgi:hypothetical protein
MATFALAVPFAAGCGGGSGGSGDKLSTDDQLKIAQDRADIDEFCALSSGGESDLYDRAFFAAGDAVNQIIEIYKKSPNATFHEPKKDQDLKMRQVTEQAASKLKGCGKDGKAQSAKLTQALQSST